LTYAGVKKTPLKSGAGIPWVPGWVPGTGYSTPRQFRILSPEIRIGLNILSRLGVNAMPKRVCVKEEIYTHEFLWRSSLFLLEKAKAEEEAVWKPLIPSLLMAFMAYEAFINFCGVVLCPKIWEKEKEHFKGKGIEGKLEVIMSKLPDFRWQKGQRPYQAIKQLEGFRDMVAHGKVQAAKYDAEAQEGGGHFRFRHEWDTYMTVEKVEKVRADIKAFCQSVLVEMRKVSGNLHLLFDAFEGALAHAEGSSID